MPNFIFYQCLIFVFTCFMSYVFACFATLYSPAWVFVVGFFVAFARNLQIEYADFKTNNQGNANV